MATSGSGLSVPVCQSGFIEVKLFEFHCEGGALIHRDWLDES